MSIEEKIKDAKEDSWLKDSVSEKEFNHIQESARKITNEEVIEQFQNTIDLIKQNGKDWLDERDIPLFKLAIKVLEQEPKTGHWIDDDGDNAICSCCNRLNHLYGDYCKHCGAKMVEQHEKEDNVCIY